jgi:enoyl-CoA hydratase/carnithine racemase
MFDSATAKSVGLVSEVISSRKEMEEKVNRLAEEIAGKSPVAVYTLKKVINY